MPILITEKRLVPIITQEQCISPNIVPIIAAITVAGLTGLCLYYVQCCTNIASPSLKSLEYKQMEERGFYLCCTDGAYMYVNMRN